MENLEAHFGGESVASRTFKGSRSYELRGSLANLQVSKYRVAEALRRHWVAQLKSSRRASVHSLCSVSTKRQMFSLSSQNGYDALSAPYV